MKSKLGSRLPSFTDAEKASLKGSADFFGLNHYGSAFTRDKPTPANYGKPGGTPVAYWNDFEAQGFHTPAMPNGASVWLYAVPWGLRKLLNWVHRRYGGPPIYVTENGWSTPGDEPWEQGVRDYGRVQFYANYTSEMQRAINEDGVDVRGYFAWSLMDNFEWERGYSERFGLVYTNFQTGERHVKSSARWYSAALQANAVVDPAPFLAPPPSDCPLCEGCDHRLGEVNSAAAAAASAHNVIVGYSALTVAFAGIAAAVVTAGGIASVVLLRSTDPRRRGRGKEDMEMLEPELPQE